MAPAKDCPKVYPKIVVFELDGTLWSGSLDEKEYGLKGLVGKKKEENLDVSSIIVTKNLVGSDIIDHVIKDKKNKDHKPAKITVHDDLIRIIQQLRKEKVAIAIASKKTNKAMCVAALKLIKFKDHDGATRSLKDVMTYIEVENVASKVQFFDKFATESEKTFNKKISCKKMLLFDTKSENIDVEQWSGASVYKIAKKAVGITHKDFQNGLDLYRAHNSWRLPIPDKGISSSKVRHIGYVGADKQNALRYAAGNRRLPSTRSARWGYGMYMADHPNVAIHYAKAGREKHPEDQYIVRLYVRDYAVFKDQMEKVWFPNKKEWEIDAVNQTQAQNADAQIELDKKVMKEFKVTKPYLVFAKHGSSKKMTFLKEPGEAFNELVLYPQLQDAMFFGEAYPIATAEKNVKDKHADWKHLHWEKQGTNWGIKRTKETTDEFKEKKYEWK